MEFNNVSQININLTLITLPHYQALPCALSAEK